MRNSVNNIKGNNRRFKEGVACKGTVLAESFGLGGEVNILICKIKKTPTFTLHRVWATAVGGKLRGCRINRVII